MDIHGNTNFLTYKKDKFWFNEVMQLIGCLNVVIAQM